MGVAYDLSKKFEIDSDEGEKFPQMGSTMEYDVFKPMQGQREVSERYVKVLASCIKDKNYLRLFPIIINEKWEVVDGQHRLEAAKSLGLRIYYFMEQGLSYVDAGKLNSVRDDWDFRNHLNNYVKNNHFDYVVVDGFITNHNLTLKRFQYLMSKEQKKIFDEKFKIGEFKIIDNLNDVSDKIKKIDDIIYFLEGILITDNKRFLQTDNFWRALYQCLISKDVQIDKFKDKLSLKYQSVRPMSGYKDYIKALMEIYNWKAKKRI
jgi:hypothetical protein